MLHAALGILVETVGFLGAPRGRAFAGVLLLLAVIWLVLMFTR